MANPIIPGIPQTEQDLLYSKLNAYNQGRASYKEVGAYLIVLPRPEHLQYTLWIYSPLPETVHLLHLRPFHRHSRNAADGKHAMLLLTAQPVAYGVQCQKNAKQRG